MKIPDGTKPFDVLNDFLVGNSHYPIDQLSSTEASDFKQLRCAYFIEGDKPPFLKRDATEQELLTLFGEEYSFVEDWLHLPTNRIMHITYRRSNYAGEMQWEEPVVFFGTKQHFVFALDMRDDGDGNNLSVIPAPKEQWDSVKDRTGTWWGKALYNEEYTDFFMYGIYGLPMHYQLLSRNDYQCTKGQTASQIIEELTSLGYQYVGDIMWTNDEMDEIFRPTD